MKDVSLLVWVSQLGLSVAVPLCGFILLAVWLRNTLGWGLWVLWVGIVLGVYSAATGLICSLRTLSRMSDKKQQPPVSFNDHD